VNSVEFNTGERGVTPPILAVRIILFRTKCWIFFFFEHFPPEQTFFLCEKKINAMFQGGSSTLIFMIYSKSIDIFFS